MKKFRLNRRAFLQGVGVSCLLPHLEVMPDNAGHKGSLKKACFYYFPNGCSNPGEDAASRKDWSWFPMGEGESYKTTKVLQPLEKFRQDFSVLGGLSHPFSRDMGGHGSAPYFLRSDGKQSIDQYIAEHLNVNTRAKSLVLGVDGGVGTQAAGRVASLSYNKNGSPVPSESNPRDIFNRYFNMSGDNTREAQLKRIALGKKNVDYLRDAAKQLEKRLGANDKTKLAEYFAAMSDTEDRIRRAELWLDVPMKKLDVTGLNLNADATVAGEHAKTIADLMVMAFQVDLVPAISYMFARENGAGIADAFPKSIGLGGHHGISHDKGLGGYERWGRYDRWVAQQFAYFLDKMKATSDLDGSLLDNTLVAYASSQSSTHTARNVPFILAGGRNMGLKHGQYRKYNEDEVRLSDLFLSMSRALGIDTNAFADSKAPLPGDLFA